MGRTGRAIRGIAVTAALALALVGFSAGPAGAEPPDFVFQVPQAEGEPGEEAGQIDNPRGVAGDPETGHMYVADMSNARINEYTAWGLFVKAWGWNVAPDGAPGDTLAEELETCGPLVPQAEPPVGLCQTGTSGDGRGQLNRPVGLAVDDAGNVYVYEWENLRVQKFSPAGEFLVMFGGEVNKTKVDEAAPEAEQNVCPIAPTDACQAGTAGEGPSHLAASISDVIAYSAAEDAILVGDKGGIQVFNLDGAYREEFAFAGPRASFADQSVNGLDIDLAGNIYFSLAGVEDVYKLSPAGEPLAPGQPGASDFEVGNPLAVAVDAQGSVYAIDDPPGIGFAVEGRVVRFDSAGEKLLPTASEEEAGEIFPYIPGQGPTLTAIATNICAGSEAPGNLYLGYFTAIFVPHVSKVAAYGTGPLGCEPPPPNAPRVTAQFAVSAGAGDATVRAQINPKYWTDAKYYVEYGPGNCSEGSCPSKSPLSPALLTEKAVNAPVMTNGVVLEGLQPGVIYRFRFVAQSSGGGPVYGIDPDGEGPEKADPEHGLEGTFKTPAPKGPAPPCPNDGFRTGAGRELPDCRGYELVSPLDKGNADVAFARARNGVEWRFFEVNQGAAAGNRFTFTSSTAFGDAESAPFSSQYLAERTASGWASAGISPPRSESPVGVQLNLDEEFHGFSDDLCQAWIRHYSVAPLAPKAIAEYPNIYRRHNCGESATYEAITTEKPPNRPPEEYRELSVKGFSVDGTHTVYTADDQLHPAAPEPEPRELLLYERSGGDTRFVCYRPSGKPIAEACSAGTAALAGVSDLSSVHNAISANGSRIFWTAFSMAVARKSYPGTIFVRIDGTETVAVSGSVGPDPAYFWTASDDGAKAIFQFVDGPRKGELYEFDLATETADLIAKGVEGPLGASEDASRVYFSSTEDLDGTGPGSKDTHNLYLYEANSGGPGGTFTFVMALAARDIGSTEVTTNNPATRPIEFAPATRAARVSADGLHAAFMSFASPAPTGYENLDATSGQPVAEVYLYDAAEGQLRCVSCNPTESRPAAGSTEGVLAAARVQGWESLLHAPRILSEDGTRVFFESHEALVTRDTNSTWDVYQWEDLGKGTCTVGSHTFSSASGGCVDLLSSGESPGKSVFLDADLTGDNAFFSTQGSLAGADYGLNDVYVARVGGGFPERTRRPACEGEACQSPPPAPPAVTPASEAFKGAGGKAGKPNRRCRKGKRRVVRKGRARCVPKRTGRRAGSTRTGARR